jgi:hypothetical protein
MHLDRYAVQFQSSFIRVRQDQGALYLDRLDGIRKGAQFALASSRVSQAACYLDQLLLLGKIEVHFEAAGSRVIIDFFDLLP